MSDLNRTPLYDTHVALGAKMVPFAGYEMPVQYKGLKVEHAAVRASMGVFDVSHMGEFWVEGPGAADFIQSVTSNDVRKLTPGKVQYSCLPNEEGGIVDDLLVYCMGAQEFMLVVNASNMAKDWAWLDARISTFDCVMRDESAGTALLAVQGPKVFEALTSITDVNVAEMPYYTVQRGTIGGVKDVIISTTGYTGAGGVEIYIPNAHVKQVWDAVMDAGADYGIEPAGLGARDTLRLEMGFCLYGNDINDATSPLEAGLGWITKFNEPFTNSEALAAQKEAGVTKRLVGFELRDRGVPRQGYPIVNAVGDVIGEVTSGTMSPSLNQAIGMGYVPKELSKSGNEIFVEVRGKHLRAEIVKLPFYKG